MPLMPGNSGPVVPHRRLELSPHDASPAGHACHPELFLVTIRLMLDGYWYDSGVARFNRMRVAKIQENKYENIDGANVAQPTGEHGAPDWFLAGGIRGPLFRI